MHEEDLKAMCAECDGDVVGICYYCQRRQKFMEEKGAKQDNELTDDKKNCLEFVLKFYKNCEYITESNLKSLCNREGVTYSVMKTAMDQLTQDDGIFEINYYVIYDDDGEEEITKEHIDDAEKSGVLITPSGSEIKKGWKSYVRWFWSATDKLKDCDEYKIRLKIDSGERCECGEHLDPKNHAVLDGVKYCFDCFDSMKNEPFDFYNDRRAQ